MSHLYPLGELLLEPFSALPQGAVFHRLTGPHRLLHVKLERRPEDRGTYVLTFGDSLTLGFIDDLHQSQSVQRLPAGVLKIEMFRFGAKVSDVQAGQLAVTEIGPVAGVTRTGAGGFMEEMYVSLVTWAFADFTVFVDKCWHVPEAKLVHQPDDGRAALSVLWTF